MQIPGWWIEGDRSGIRITPALLDDTELSETSGWTEAHQNEDATLAHGFTKPDALLRDVRRRLGIES